MITEIPINKLTPKMNFFHPKNVAKPTPKGVPMLIAKKVKGKTAPAVSLLISEPLCYR